MHTQPALRAFFERQLAPLDSVPRRPALDEDQAEQHLVSHLIEQTVHRAALDAATHRFDADPSEADRPSPSWDRCLMVAALTELRPVKLLRRN